MASDTRVAPLIEGSPYAPSRAGYAAVFGLAFASFALVLTVMLLEEDGTGLTIVSGPILAAQMLVVVFAVGVLAGGLPAALGIVLVHVACRRARWQWVHVLGFGLAGAVVSGPPLILLTDPTLLFHPLQVLAGLCSCVARLAVVPWVPSVRGRKHAGGG